MTSLQTLPATNALRTLNFGVESALAYSAPLFSLLQPTFHGISIVTSGGLRRALFTRYRRSAHRLQSHTNPEPNSDDPGEDGQDTADTDEPVPCLAMLYSVSPEDGATNVSTSTTVDVTFSEAALDGEWDVAIVGVDGTSTLDESGTVATFTPSAPLDYETEYTIQARVCQNTASGGFTTGAAPLDTSILDGRTYELPYSALNWQAPNAASLMASFINFDSFLVQVDEIDDSAQTIEVLSTVGYSVNGSTSPECDSIFSPGTGDFSQNPMFRAGPGNMYFPVGATDELTIEDFSLQASFNSDGTAIESIKFTGRGYTPSILLLVATRVRSRPSWATPVSRV